ncbi:hypothetical protein JL722_13545 [Aureococcus anophagefferens]|nr:hypothetical protein JL722_13545 [Aureococcus anophagefferens]
MQSLLLLSLAPALALRPAPQVTRRQALRRSSSPMQMSAVMDAPVTYVVVGGEQVGVKKAAKFDTSNMPVTEADVLACQEAWAGAIVAASAIYADGGDYIGAAAGAANELYGYGFTKVLFKPTKAAEYPSAPRARTPCPTSSAAAHRGRLRRGRWLRDQRRQRLGEGRVPQPRRRLNGPTATAMGYYIFTDATTKAEVRVEYTFGYKRCSDGKVRIYLHHSSVPYSSAPAASSGVAAMTQAEVLDCQAKWANAIKTISKTYADKGDYVGAAADAAGELYGYGHSQVLFKPTKAAEYPFRPTGEEAMSYFVGNNAAEAATPRTLASPSTAARAGRTSSAGYKRNDDGKPRIFLHHSSVPYAA